MGVVVVGAWDWIVGCYFAEEFVVVVDIGVHLDLAVGTEGHLDLAVGTEDHSDLGSVDHVVAFVEEDQAVHFDSLPVLDRNYHLVGDWLIVTRDRIQIDRIQIDHPYFDQDLGVSHRVLDYRYVHIVLF